MEEVETLKAERAVIDSELKNTNPDMQSTFLSAAASGSLNEPNISLASLGRTFGPLQHQVTDGIRKQEKIIAEVQDLYQPFIQVRIVALFFALYLYLKHLHSLFANMNSAGTRWRGQQ